MKKLSKSNIKIEFDHNALSQAISDAISNSSFDISCPNCNSIISFDGSLIGSNITCPYCNVNIKLDDQQLKQDLNKLKI